MSLWLFNILLSLCGIVNAVLTMTYNAAQLPHADPPLAILVRSFLAVPRLATTFSLWGWVAVINSSAGGLLAAVVRVWPSAALCCPLLPPATCVAVLRGCCVCHQGEVYGGVFSVWLCPVVPSVAELCRHLVMVE